MEVFLCATNFSPTEKDRWDRDPLFSALSSGARALSPTLPLSLRVEQTPRTWPSVPLSVVQVEALDKIDRLTSSNHA